MGAGAARGVAAAALLCAWTLPAAASPAYETREMSGWTVKVRADFPPEDRPAVAQALKLMAVQMAKIARAVPEPALSRLREFPLYVAPAYPGFPPGGMYHPDSGWLVEHRRDPAMAGGVEITNVRIFDKETARMPFFILHELAHAYHDRVLGLDDEDILDAYRQAVAGGRYDAVEQVNWPGQPHTRARAYALTDFKEYFAESTEAFFGRNDFYPFTRADLKKTDPVMFEVLTRKWGVAP